MSGMVHRSMDDEDAETGASNRKLGNGHNQESALQLFVNAKKKINDIFRNIGQYVLEADKFVQDVTSVPECSVIVGPENSEVVHGFCEKIDGITEVLARDHMKVVFFGRTSNGKSTVINAMLRDKILPSGIGHTTHCFIQVEGSDSKDGFLLTEDTDKPKSITDIKQLASALSDVKLQENSLIRILWPKEKCRLLREDVVLVDSPGIDVSPDLDLWIDKFCVDADVFVLVANAESTLMQTEKNFFHKVSEKLSKPNIFILQNRWDVSEMEEDIDQVKQQHIDRNSDFLAEELKVTDKKGAKDRLFFVSAREALASRLNNDNVFATPERVLLPGFQARLFEFANFEKEFEVCISQSAVKTKFEQHTNRAHYINSELRTVMEEAYTKSLSLQDEQMQLRKEKSDRLSHLDRQLDLLTGEVKNKIKAMVEDVERKVSCALNDEIRRLSVLVEEFERPFHPDAMLLNVYKKELHMFVEEQLCLNLSGRCTGPILRNTDLLQHSFADRLSAILPEESKQQLLNLMPKRDFEIAYRLDCRNLCAGFREDIEFRFSLSPTALVQRFLGTKGQVRFLEGSDSLFQRGRQMSSEAAGALGGDNPLSASGGGDNEILISVLATFASLTSRSTLGAAVVTGLVAKAAGWRVIVVTGALYGGVYLYERLTWTSKARERAFKQQYVDYASSKLRLIIDLTSSNCSHQVQQELTSTFARLCHQADVTKQQLEAEVKQVDKGLTIIKEISSRAKSLRNKADFFDRELQGFVAQFLRHAGL
ncbi:mitofusin-2 isoform X1 [Aplysia californica]|uniref:Mitofusin-2 isoform X1 n=1 Tax=Aplysia californica TaxID=6500 RepID=A0ABM1AAU3_APLCA|nr:mitofusin-2 isoform X1 [Aplysia californica]XP_035828574.1 mitofusin-2 isoform X1 [Aplysia californica]XP_035828575.1 mitofusin-2 isoform X1 [Aplysia californica]